MGPIDTIMEVLHMTNKGHLMDTFEKYHIYKETQINNQIIDKCPIKPNVIFDTVVQHQFQNREQSATLPNYLSVSFRCSRRQHTDAHCSM
jgi:hypothetical protein